MDTLWSPWRYTYVSSASADRQCVFCAIAQENDDEKNYVILRGERNFIVLNRYPYTTGHLMIVPFAHVGSLEEADIATLDELIHLAQRAEKALRSVYRAEGFNMGLNIGHSAGAGVPGHIHMHALPRWQGDTNFMTTIGETRVLSEDLETTFRRLSAAFRAP